MPITHKIHKSLHWAKLIYMVEKMNDGHTYIAQPNTYSYYSALHVYYISLHYFIKVKV